MRVLSNCAALAATVLLTTTPLAAAGGQQQPLPPSSPATTARPTAASQTPARTSAPPARRSQPRGFVAAGALFQPGKSSFTDARTFTSNRESATQTGEYDIDSGIGFDLGVFARVWRSLGAGVSVTQVNRTGQAAFSASIPHPFFFNQPRTATTTAADLDRTETGVHLSAAYLLPTSGRFGLTLFGGPSFFTIKQDVISDLAITDVYPYDTIAIAPGARSNVSESAVGFHAGADATWYFTRQLGAGALVRYASGKKSVSIGSGNSFDLEAGGVQASIGLRLKF